MKAKTLFFSSLMTFFVSMSTIYGQTYSAPSSAATAPFNNTNIGSGAGSNNGGGNAYENVAVGYYSSNSTASGALNTYVGSKSGGFGSTANSVSGSRNCFYGAYSGYLITSGSNNTGLGYGSLNKTTTGNNNIAIGDALFNNSTASNNIGIGYSALYNLTGSSGNVNDNVGIGNSAGKAILTGTQNVFLGFTPGISLNNGSTNVFIGSQAGQNIINGTNNILIGTNSGYNLSSTTGTLDKNTLIGFGSGYSLATGVKNTFLGSVNVSSTSSTTTQAGNNTSNTIILADGDGNQGFFCHSNGNVGLGLVNNSIPQNRLEINATSGIAGLVANTMGLRFRGINNPNFNPSSSSTRKVLSVNTSGDVILVDDIGGGINTSCNTAGILPLTVVNAGVTSLGCSQIFDNGTSVGVGTGSQLPAYFNYTYSAGDDAIGVVPLSGTARLKVNGVTWSGGFYASSDGKFKKNIKPIESALKTVQSIEGKTYNWNKESNKEMDFDGGNHSGFIAQELEKILPHLVATDERGNKAVNYMELMPYLVEAIKEQQTQINDLKTQITENFKVQNQDLIELTNTKIINVSPNPSKDLITVSFNVEKSVQSAKLQVHDLNGTIISSLTINDRDNNITRTLQKDNFGKGIYVVSLVVNGKSIDTKKIVFN